MRIYPCDAPLTAKGTELTGSRIRRYETVELFGRDLKGLAHVAKHSLDIPDGGTTLPRRIIYPIDFFPLPDPSHQELVDEFVKKLEGHLGVGKTELSLAQSWQDKPPSESFAAGRSLQDYLKKVTISLCLSLSVAHRVTRGLILCPRPHSGPCAMIITRPQANSGPIIVTCLTRSPSLRHLPASTGMVTPAHSLYRELPS